MKPYNTYLFDISFRSFYTIFSFLICLALFFNNINTILLFESLPLLNILDNKRLIVTHITHLFSVIFLSCYIWSLFFVFPLFLYHMESFLLTSWYIYQLKFYIYITKNFKKVYIFLYFINYLLIIPNIITFFLYWEVTNKSSLLKIDAEISILYYIIWSYNFKFSFSLYISNLLIILILIYNFLTTVSLYIYIKKYKKLIFFFFLCILFLLIPPDLIIQINLTLLSYFFFEITFLRICIKLYISNKKI